MPMVALTPYDRSVAALTPRVCASEFGNAWNRDAALTVQVVGHTLVDAQVQPVQ